MSPILIIIGVCAVLGGVIGRLQGEPSEGIALKAARGAIVGLLLGFIGAVVYDRVKASPPADPAAPAVEQAD